MNFDISATERWSDLAASLHLVMPEVWLVLAMCAVIIVPFIKRQSVTLPAVTALVGLGLALYATVVSAAHVSSPMLTSFHGMLSIDPFSQFFKMLLILFTMLVVGQWLITGRQSTGTLDTPDFLCLLLGATVGMALMASASNLLMIFIATESASLPSFALAGWRKRTTIGSEASLKYVVFGAAASAISVYGMSLIYATTGTLDLAGVAAASSAGLSPLLAVGILAMFAGFAFKLSAVPLHFWCPDVFQGAPIEITTFLSVASKGAAVCLLIRVLAMFGVAASGAAVFTGIGVGVAILGAVTATWGNLVALHQTNIKRLLAYSSIAHAGYMIMTASVVIFAHQRNEPTEAALAVSAILFYLLVYLFMNLGAFTVAALIAQRSGHEDIRDYAGLVRTAPMLAVLMIVFLLSLFGMPGLGGFMGKIYLMAAMSTSAAGFALITVLLLNTLVSLYYYMRPAYYMVFREPEQSREIEPRPGAVGLLAVCAVVVVLTGILPQWFNSLAGDHATLLRPTTIQPQVADDDADPLEPMALTTRAAAAPEDPRRAPIDFWITP